MIKMFDSLLSRLGILFFIILAGVIFLTLKKRKKLQKMTEENTVKIEGISYKDKSGEHTEDILIKRSRLPFLGDWKRVYPIYNEDDTINKINWIFGGKKNLIKLVVIIILIILVYLFIVNSIGAGAKYLNGDEFVIVNKTLFNQYCQSETPIVSLNNLNVTING